MGFPFAHGTQKDGSWRPCGDYRRLNLLTTQDKYPLPNIKPLFNGLHGGCTVFSKINLVKGYHQILVMTEDIPKTEIITPFGLFEYLFTPFGLSNAAQTFQRMMDRTTDGLEGVFAYMDYSRVGSPDRQTHLHHPEAFFTALAANDLAINLEKCVFATPSLEILGHKFRWQERSQQPITLPKSRDHWHPLGFFSHKLTNTESRYLTFHRKLLAAQAAIKHFHHFCEGQAFQLWTYHKPLVTAVSRVSALILPRQQHHLVFISDLMYKCCICPVWWKSLLLFGPPKPNSHWIITAMSAADPVDFKEMAAKKNRCPETQRLLGGTSLKLAFRQTGAQRLAEDVSTGTFRPIVPLKFRKTISVHFHNVAHPGRLASHCIVSSRFVWRGLASDVTAWARACPACQRGKIHRHTRLAPQPIPILQWRFFTSM
jgi:hypothetical protein